LALESSLYGGEAALAAKVRPTVKNFANSRHQAKRRPFSRQRNLTPANRRGHRAPAFNRRHEQLLGRNRSRIARLSILIRCAFALSAGLDAVSSISRRERYAVTPIVGARIANAALNVRYGSRVDLGNVCSGMEPIVSAGIFLFSAANHAHSKPAVVYLALRGPHEHHHSPNYPSYRPSCGRRRFLRAGTLVLNVATPEPL